MERSIEETTTAEEAAQGRRSFRFFARDAADDLMLAFSVQRREEIALFDEQPRYEPTGNLCFNGQLADELTHLVSALNRTRHSVHLHTP